MKNARTLENRTASTRTRRSHFLRVRELRRGGFTLIEILVALVVFVVGALAIVRIFPPALGVIQNSENRTVASNLSRGTLASYENDPNLIPDAIYELNTSPQGIAFVGSINTNNALPADGKPDSATYDDSSFGHLKFIDGERQRILFDPNTLGGRPYVLTQFPYAPPTFGAPSYYTVAAAVEDRVEGVRTDASGNVDFSNARLSSDGRAFNDVEYTRADGSPRSAVGTNRKAPPREWAFAGNRLQFYATYNWVKGGRIQGVIDDPMINNGTGTFLGDPLRAANNGGSVVPGPIGMRVKRTVSVFIDISMGSPDALRGYVPLFYNGLDDLLRGGNLVYSSVSLSYQVNDWRWMVEDTTFAPNTTAAPVDITVPTRFIDAENLTAAQRTNPANAGSIFTLVTETPNSAGTSAGAPPRAATLSRARWDGTSTTPITPATGSGLDAVDAKAGILKFRNVYTSSSPRRVRIVYRTTDQWVRQLSVAARSYVPFLGLLDNPEPHRNYWWDEDNIASDSNADVTRRDSIYFRPSEVGKTVIVEFEYLEGGIYKIKTAPMTIEDEAVDRPDFIPAAFTDLKFSRLQLTDPTTNGAPYNVKAIRSIRGASVMVRTAWADGGRYQQEVASTYRPLDEN